MNRLKIREKLVTDSVCLNKTLKNEGIDWKMNVVMEGRLTKEANICNVQLFLPLCESSTEPTSVNPKCSKNSPVAFTVSQNKLGVLVEEMKEALNILEEHKDVV